MSSDDGIAQLKAQLCKVKANKARWHVNVKVEVNCNTAEEKQITKEKVAAEAEEGGGDSCGGPMDC